MAGRRQKIAVPIEVSHAPRVSQGQADSARLKNAASVSQRELAEAVEDHNVEKVAQLLPVAKQSGVSDAELHAAEQLLEYSQSQSWRDERFKVKLKGILEDLEFRLTKMEQEVKHQVDVGNEAIIRATAKVVEARVMPVLEQQMKDAMEVATRSMRPAAATHCEISGGQSRSSSPLIGRSGSPMPARRNYEKAIQDLRKQTEAMKTGAPFIGEESRQLCSELHHRKGLPPARGRASIAEDSGDDERHLTSSQVSLDLEGPVTPSFASATVTTGVSGSTESDSPGSFSFGAMAKAKFETSTVIPLPNTGPKLSSRFSALMEGFTSALETEIAGASAAAISGKAKLGSPASPARQCRLLSTGILPEQALSLDVDALRIAGAHDDLEKRIGSGASDLVEPDLSCGDFIDHATGDAGSFQTTPTFSASPRSLSARLPAAAEYSMPSPLDLTAEPDELHAAPVPSSLPDANPPHCNARATSLQLAAHALLGQSFPPFSCMSAEGSSELGSVRGARARVPGALKVRTRSPSSGGGSGAFSL